MTWSSQQAHVLYRRWCLGGCELADDAPAVSAMRHRPADPAAGQLPALAAGRAQARKRGRWRGVEVRARPIRGGQALPPLHLATQLDDAYRAETCHKFHNARPWSSVGVAPGRQLATRYAIGSARTVAMRGLARSPRFVEAAFVTTGVGERAEPQPTGAAERHGRGSSHRGEGQGNPCLAGS